MYGLMGKFIAADGRRDELIGAMLDSIGVDGDLDLARRFVALFPLPPKAC